MLTPAPHPPGRLLAEVAVSHPRGKRAVQYTRACYTDVYALWFAERLHEGAVPYREHPVEYPVLTAA
jgi:hypothetical protein